MPSNCGAREDSWESLGQQGDQTSQSQSNSTLNIHWKDWCWSWNFSFLVIWCEQTTHWKSSWCWERLRAEGEEGVRGWDGCTASPMQQTWTCANSRGWWGTGRTGMLQSMGSQRAGYNWRTEQHQRHSKGFCFCISIILNCEVKWSEVVQLCLTLCDPMDYSLLRSSVHGIF